ncbi:MAG: hypothetical protein M9942_07145 [Microthrixaceae bacterium]|nr:hypothetical protein [Microthrixaceae bacterium]MCO5318200.1 hypothetical protein [Microthrixaceae bacterium]
MRRVPTLPEPLCHAMPQSEFLDDIDARLEARGFTPESTLAAVSICRDELTQHLIADVTRRWGPTFALGGLGGIPALGRTGWGACLAHVPDTMDRGRLLVVGATHIGIGPDGSPGHNLRPGQGAPTPTCGALSALEASWGEHPPAGPDESGLADGEAQLLRSLVEDQLDSPPSDLVELTRAATAAVEAEMMAQLDALDRWDVMDVAVVTGVQVHLDGIEDHFLPARAVVRGERGSTAEL